MSSELVLCSTRDGVTTLTLNMPKRLNGWTQPMLAELKLALTRAASDDETRAVILTGADPYYCAGVNLGGTIRLDHPRRLHALIAEHNEALFNAFLEFPKPILVAVNGPAIGASVTSATLCDGIIASERATFSTPFAALGVPAEGCSSVLFPRMLGAATADRILGEEGWKPTAAEALEIGLVQWVVAHEELLDEAHEIAKRWADAGTARRFRGGISLHELQAANARESQQIADAFLAAPFLRGQFRFLWGKRKRGPALMFLALWLLRPIWSLLL
ncbi:enoyl-CoA hydratase/isomerase family protein [Enhygromyxa salina]|uniref:4-chlorobenzoyl coenzyme A dehalogenase-1 n=1 Tax=Enhygromyxa salina TaxID=215803 RepID=A0A2S9YC09_9BACT|nr:enoyl-CoA hydratase/isomerase family protein [Enhygromyxa salina]PRQ02592.1 4-chlorobenzoyl coenzyme A dehalogenase-1 [Enhygromyxa salina]